MSANISGHKPFTAFFSSISLFFLNLDIYMRNWLKKKRWKVNPE